MTLISSNIRFLRKRLGLTQDDFAKKLDLKRSAIGAYEEGRAEPKLSTLAGMADFFSISMDRLISEDLTITSVENHQRSAKAAGASPKSEAKAEPEIDTEGKKLRILSITVDPYNTENIELVPHKAAAGYLQGYEDSDYLMNELQRFQLPMLPQGTYRAFEITGDSMLPVVSGSVIICQYVENWNRVKSGQLYIFVTATEGIVFKRAYNHLESGNKVILHSDNPLYQPFEVNRKDILEVWSAKAYFSTHFPEPEMSVQKLAGIVMDLQQEMIKLKGAGK